MSKFFSVLFVGVLFLIIISPVLAQGPNCTLGSNPDPCKTSAGPGFSCQPSDDPRQPAGVCKPDTVGSFFGKISPPPELKPFLKNDTTGASGISAFLSNLIALFYSMAAIAVVFMLVWGAFEWLTSGGNKEQLEKARNRIISAMVAILLFAAIFAILNVLGVFTGFEFFAKPPAGCIVNGQNICGRR